VTAPIYDSRETGPRYHVTSRIEDHTITFQAPIEDPFVRHTIRIHWRDLLSHLLHFRRFLTVTVIVGGDLDVMEAVLELDENYLGPRGSERHQKFNERLNRAMVQHVDDEDFREITEGLKAEGDPGA